MSDNKLDSMTKTCRCVINFPFKDGKIKDIINDRVDDACEQLSANCYQYACILHDKDTDKNGVLKTMHLHLVFECPKRHRLSFFINRLSEYFDVSRVCISVQVSNSMSGDIQYLIHMNNADKHQYSVDEIKTNLPSNELKEHLSREIHKELTAEYILSVVKSCRTKSSVIMKLGIGNYNVFHHIVDTFCRDGWLGYDLNNSIGEKI